MAQYHKELTKWIKITLDKLFMEQSFADPSSRLSAEQIYPLLKFHDGMTEADFLRQNKRPRAKSRQLLQEYFRSGLIEKVADPIDARKRRLVLSDSGRSLRERIEALVDDKIEFLLRDMTVNEEVAVLKFISRINQLTVEKYEIK
ncbi:MAG TPA: hypothetical protein GXZ74_04700 [Tissierellia bacterium]|nr:hypothetical protein [Tissierellia bacterium]